ncbi:MAG: hypothetical protein KGL74_14770 [Elusimicrobia bacterium]|nr:hypothetical protein [Elusimicrobiota bacterium]
MIMMGDRTHLGDHGDFGSLADGFEPLLSDQTGATRDDSAFARLIHPLPVSSFFHEYWERRPLVIERAAPAVHPGLERSADSGGPVHQKRRFGRP